VCFYFFHSLLDTLGSNTNDTHHFFSPMLTIGLEEEKENDAITATARPISGVPSDSSEQTRTTVAAAL